METSLKFRSWKFLLIMFVAALAGIAGAVSEFYTNPWRMILLLTAGWCLIMVGLLIGWAHSLDDTREMSYRWNEYWRNYYDDNHIE